MSDSPAHYRVGDRVIKNPATWKPNAFDEWGRGIGAGVVVEPPFPLLSTEVDVRWPAGRCFETVDQLLPVPWAMDAMQTLTQSWRRVCAGLAPAPEALFNDLISRYSEPHRHYHTLQHLAECMRTFEPVQSLTAFPAEIEMALWFHDAVYDCHRSDNEEQSATLAQESLKPLGLMESSIDRVTALVLATKHAAAPSSPEEQLIVDVDLSIFAASEARFAEYEEQIRAEYSFVEPTLFRTKRREILQRFLDRPRIFSTPDFHRTHEQRARENIRRAIAAVGNPRKNSRVPLDSSSGGWPQVVG